MKNCLLITMLFLVSCYPAKSRLNLDERDYLGTLRKSVGTIITWENSLQSTDVSYNYPVMIGEDLYPNSPHYRLTNKKRFQRSRDESGLGYTIEYYTSPDDSIRVILHEWNTPQTTADGIKEGSDRYDERMRQAFDKQFMQIRERISRTLGEPTLVDIHPGYMRETERDDVKWLSTRQPNAYLLLFKRDEDLYRQIRLVVYLK